MKPYFERDGITIFHGDCREVLKDFTTGGVSLVVTDPPYRSLDEHVSRGTTTRLVAGGDTAWFPTLTDDELRAVLATIRDNLLHAWGAMYVFADWKTGLRVFRDPEPANVLIWDKMKIGMGYNWRRMNEWIGYFPKPEHELRDKGLGDIIRARGIPSEQRTHPTEKPVGVLKPLIENSTVPGGSVLDPFMGTGSTLRAAKALGRTAIGIEIEERYCELAARSLEQEVMVLA